MNAYARRVTRVANRPASLGPSAKHHLASLDTSKVAQRLVVFTPTAADIDYLLPQARRQMGGGAATEVVHRIFRHNPDSVWAIARRENFAAGVTRAEGYVAYLMLNRAGMDSLFNGTFRATDPDLSLICRQSETPAGIYVWGIYARGVIAGGIPLTYEKVCTPRYRDVSLYARGATADGCRIIEALGFALGANHEGNFQSHLYMFERGPRQPKNPIYDTYAPGAPKEKVSVTVARSLEDLMRVISVRSAVYVGEQECPYPEEFDGNDFAGVNLLGYAGNEPAGCLRIRCFADFAKLERLAVRREYRNLRMGTMLMQAGVEFCRAKGYRYIYGRAEKNLLDYYLAMGWKPLKEGRRRVVFSDHEYVEIVFEATPNTDAISLESDPYVLMRPEGRWHMPGILERSAIRPVSRPSANRQRERASA